MSHPHALALFYVHISCHTNVYDTIQNMLGWLRGQGRHVFITNSHAGMVIFVFANQIYLEFSYQKFGMFASIIRNIWIIGLHLGFSIKPTIYL